MSIAQQVVNRLLEAAVPLVLHLHLHLRNLLQLHNPRQTDRQYQGIPWHQI